MTNVSISATRYSLIFSGLGKNYIKGDLEKEFIASGEELLDKCTCAMRQAFLASISIDLQSLASTLEKIT